MLKYFSNLQIRINSCTCSLTPCFQTFARMSNPKNRFKMKSTVPPSEIYLSVLGNGSVSSPPSLYMFTDYERYLFNCGEGTQRIAHEYKMKFTKLNNVFITHANWKNLGGLIGLSLTIQDLGIPGINLHGPKNIETLYEHATPFFSSRQKFIAKTWDKSKNFVDSCMEVQYIIIGKEENTAPVNDTEDSKLTEDDSYPCAKRLKSTEERCSDVAVCYACKAHNKPGKLMLEKCIEYGVPPGPLLGKLKSGNDITLSNGITVQAKDVLSEEQKSPIFLVVECPLESLLHSFVNEEKFVEYQTASNAAALVVHFTSPHIFKMQQYQEWITRFPDSTCHLVLNSESASVNSGAVHRIQHKLNLLHPHVFSLLHESEVHVNYGEDKKNIFQAKTNDKYLLRPFKGLDKNSDILTPALYVEEAFNVEGFESSLKHLRDSIKIEENSSSVDGSKKSPEVVFLGTGSSIPSKVRNVSGILVKLSNDKCILMDCGEGTCGQLFRLYGTEATNLVLQQLCCVFISHMHADHHVGLVQLLINHKKAVENINSSQPLIIIGPYKLITWLKDYDRTFEEILPNYRFLDCYSSKHNFNNTSNMEDSILNDCCPNIDVATVPVHHCMDAHGIVLSHRLKKWKIVYSGDTTPCEALVAAGRNCTLLIHEATMEDDLGEEAALKRHSTTSEAIRVAEKMNAKHTILTHFSQRYAKVPLFNENFHNNIGCAFDNMKVHLCDLHLLPLFIPTLKHLFAEDIHELQETGIKRRERKNALKSVIASVSNCSK